MNHPHNHVNHVNHQHGYVHQGHRYNHMCYKGSWHGWTRRFWWRRHRRWIYWSPVDGCWYSYYGSQFIYLPEDDMTNADFND